MTTGGFRAWKKSRRTFSTASQLRPCLRDRGARRHGKDFSRGPSAWSWMARGRCVPPTSTLTMTQTVPIVPAGAVVRPTDRGRSLQGRNACRGRRIFAKTAASSRCVRTAGFF